MRCETRFSFSGCPLTKSLIRCAPIRVFKPCFMAWVFHDQCGPLPARSISKNLCLRLRRWLWPVFFLQLFVGCIGASSERTDHGSCFRCLRCGVSPCHLACSQSCHGIRGRL